METTTVTTDTNVVHIIEIGSPAIFKYNKFPITKIIYLTLFPKSY